MLNKNLNVLYAMNQCVKSIHRLGSRLREQGSIQQTNKTQRRLEQDLCKCIRCAGVHFTARALQGLRARPKGAARSVAIVIGIVLSIASMPISKAQNLPLKVLANYQLTDKQYKCHNEIVYRESRWNERAKNGSHYGYYQGRSIHLKDAHYEYQFYWYWYYVSNRYGLTQYDEPNYCNALNHLIRKGFQ
jgi:hypothetical protein